MGECVVIHLGYGQWMVVDSCVDTRSKRPIALDYLSALNVDIKEQLQWIVVSHWHNDHMRGAAEIVRQAPKAILLCSAALRIKEFYQLVSASTHDKLGTNDLPEFAEIFEILRQRSPHSKVPSTGIEWVKSDQMIYSRPLTEERQGVLVHALSPSSDTFTMAQLEFAPFLPEYKAPKRRPVAISPNRVSITLWVRFGNARVLLGSDLEECGVPTMGWQGILASPNRPTGPVQIFKVPHHGSETAHNDEVWKQMVQSDAVAIMTPYLSGPKPLPSDADVARIKARTDYVYCTAPRTGFRSMPRRDRAVEKIMQRQLRAVAGPMGHVRLRMDSRSTAGPKVELFSPAHSL